MIASFRHKGLQRLFEHEDYCGVVPELARKLKRILAALDTAEAIDELRLFPGWRLHQLRGELRGQWSITISGNWRVVFRFENGNASNVDLVDYH